MLFILNVIAPVFTLVGAGYLAVRLGLFPNTGTRALVLFVNSFATPCLLFRAVVDVDVADFFDLEVLGGYYLGALISLALGIAAGRILFAQRPGAAVVTGFAACFSNGVLLGVPIIQRAYGDASLQTPFSIIAIHAALLFTIGVIVMELSRRDGAGTGAILKRVGKGIVGNAILWGAAVGFTVNLTNLPIPEFIDASTAMMAAAVVPAALFGLGGALNDYKLRESWQPALAATALKLLVLPAIVWVVLIPILNVPHEIARTAIVLAAMPAGINVYVFATYYDRSVGVAANTILISTALGFLTISAWLAILA